MDFSESELTTACALLFGASWVAAGGRPGDVGAEELKLAFRRRAFAAHPDRAGRLGRAEEDLAAEFRAVGAAHALIVSYRDARQRGEATLVGARDAPRVHLPRATLCLIVHEFCPTADGSAAPLVRHR